MKQLLVFAGDVGDKFFEPQAPLYIGITFLCIFCLNPGTLPCFDKVAVKDRNLDSDFIDLDNLLVKI